MPFKDAFNCPKCPQSGDPRGDRACPAWWEVVEKNDTGDMRVTKGCAWEILPRFLTDVMKFAHQASSTAVQTREDILTKINEVTNGSLPIVGRLVRLPSQPGGRYDTSTDLPKVSGPQNIPRPMVEIGGGGDQLEPRGERGNGREANIDIPPATC